MSASTRAVRIVTGLTFFTSDNLDLLRLPDVYARLGAPTNVNDLGLGVIGLVPLARKAVMAVRFTLAGGLMLVSSAADAHLMKRTERR